MPMVPKEPLEYDNGRGMGWTPELPDFRDFPMRMIPRLAERVSIPERHSNRDVQSPVKDQGYIGSCVGCSVASAVEMLRRTDADDFSTIYSGLYAYWYARAQQGWEAEDTGAYIRDAMKATQKAGIAPESAWKYREELFAKKPTPSADRKAARWRLGVYATCDDPNPRTTLQNILTGISQGFPVVGGFTCYSNMFTRAVDESGDIPMPLATSYIAGGHAVLFVGYDLSTQRLTFKNSWSEQWGDQGYGTLPFAYVDQGLADDFWVMSAEDVSSVRADPKYNVLIRKRLGVDSDGIGERQD